MSSVPVMSSIPPNFVLGEPTILYLLRGGLEDFWGPHAFQRGMVGKNQSSWQSTRGGDYRKFDYS